MTRPLDILSIPSNQAQFAGIIALAATRFVAGRNETHDINWTMRIQRYYADLCDTDLSPLKYPEAWKDAYKYAAAEDITDTSFEAAFPPQWLADFKASWENRHRK